jgi:hypothetical protein
MCAAQTAPWFDHQIGGKPDVARSPASSAGIGCRWSGWEDDRCDGGSSSRDSGARLRGLSRVGTVGGRLLHKHQLYPDPSAAHGFTNALLDQLVRDGLATIQPGTTRAGTRRITVVWKPDPSTSVWVDSSSTGYPCLFGAHCMIRVKMRRRTGPRAFRELQRREWYCESAP